MRSTQQLLIAVATLAILSSSILCHDMNHGRVVKETRVDENFGNWLGDMFFLICWPIGYIFILPIGWLITLLGFPGVYDSMVYGGVTGAFGLTRKYERYD